MPDSTPETRLHALVAHIDRQRSLQPEHMRTLPVAPTLDGSGTGHDARVDDIRAVLKELKELRKRDADLSAMEAAGVDNWEGMGEVEWPDDEDEDEDDYADDATTPGSAA
jgi:hypothetical protein